MGVFWNIDKNGFLVNDAEFYKIQQEFENLIDATRRTFIESLGKSMHSCYLTGSIPRGLAVKGLSDLDAFAILKEGETNQQKPIDVGPATKEYQTSLCPSPIVVYQDSISTYNKAISDQLISIGRKMKLNPQHAVFEHYGSDASFSHSRGQAAKVALLCFPVENTHGYEITHKSSLDFCCDLLTEYILSSE